MPNRSTAAASSRRLSIPQYRRHKKPGKEADRAYVTINGRQIYLGAFGSQESHDQYDRLIAEYLANGRIATPTDAERLSINELLLAYLQFAAVEFRTNGEPSNAYHEIRHALQELAQLYGMTPANAFGSTELKVVRRAMLDKKLEKMKFERLTRKGINKRISRICRVFSWGVENKLVNHAVHYELTQVSGLKPYSTSAVDPDPIRPVEDERIEAVEPFVSRQVWAMIRLQRLTGMRPGEVRHLTSGEVDQSQDVWTYRPKRHKTRHHGHERPIFFGPRGQAILSEWIRADPDTYLFSPAEAEKERRAKQRAARKTKVQPSQKNRRKSKPKRQPRTHYDKDAYYRAVQRACKRAEINPWHPNQIRHTAATEISQRSINPMTASTLLATATFG